MATEHEDAHVPDAADSLEEGLFVAGAVGGLIAGVLMGLLMHYVMEIMEVVGGLYTMNSVTAGWIFHLVHAVLFGLLFAVALNWSAFDKYDFGPVAVGLLGLAWGVTLWMVAAGLIMPLWMDQMAFAQVPDVPNWDTQSGIGHLVYGATLGVVVAIARWIGR